MITTEEYRTLWKEAIHLCEIETDEIEAKDFVHKYYSARHSFEHLSNKELIIIFVGLVVYETRFCGFYGYGSATPAKFCYREILNRRSTDELKILNRQSTDELNQDLVFDIGDWAAEYATNPYIPMDTCRGYGPRKYFYFENAKKKGLLPEQIAKKERVAKLREEGRKKVEAAKIKHLERKNTILELKTKSIEQCLKIIENDGKSIFYYYELILEWFKTGNLDDETKTYILSMFPMYSTRHNIRLRRKIEDLY